MVLRISDTGPGIPVAERERVFSRFYRMVGETQPGSGLGLAIAQEVTQQRGAKLTLEDPEKAPSGLTVQLAFESRVGEEAVIVDYEGADLKRRLDYNGGFVTGVPLS
jgi:signal transduction histidine kinase